MNPGALSVLSRIRAGRPEPPPYERCEMCGAPRADDHPHVVNISTRTLMCTCRPCYLLFTHDDAELAYRAVPDRYLSFETIPAPVWVFINSTLERLVAFYPGPAGATESELSLRAWERVVAAVPGLSTLQPDVEALLVHSAEQTEAFLVPIDVCYELVGHLRMLWRGFDGGQDVRKRLTEFFAHLRAKSRPAVAP
jgi:hypothetical protein